MDEDCFNENRTHFCCSTTPLPGKEGGEELFTFDRATLASLPQAGRLFKGNNWFHSYLH